MAAAAHPHTPPHDSVDPLIWYAFAGVSRFQLPAAGSTVVYFPQGHAEQASDYNLLSDLLPRNVPPALLCKVLRLDLLADKSTDEAFVRLQCQPLAAQISLLDVDESDERESPPCCDKPASFAKTLTQSDANNGGGFSIPRFCAETIFPRLDYSHDPPVQTVLAKDIHGNAWKFRHIYRGTPRRHLLTTGWSNFVNHKRLVAGDVVVFVRNVAGELCVGVRRSKRNSPSLNPPLGTAYSHGFVADKALTHFTDKAFLHFSASGFPPLAQSCEWNPVAAQSVVKSVRAASTGVPFEIIYYPRAAFHAGFCVKASVVKASLQHGWAPGMRIKMAVETADSSRTSWYMGTILKVMDADPVRWPASPWKMLQVTWDEAILGNTGRVSPWQVELVASTISPPVSLPMKKPRLSSLSESPFSIASSLPFLREFQRDGDRIVGALSPNLLGQSDFWDQIAWREPGMEGTRHSQTHGLSVQGSTFNHQPQSTLDNTLCSIQGQRICSYPLVSESGLAPRTDVIPSQCGHLTTLTVGSSSNSDPASSSNVSCCEEGQTSSPKGVHFMLFGKSICIGESTSKAQQPSSVRYSGQKSI